MKLTITLVLAVLLLWAVVGCAPSKPPLETVAAVDLHRYLGLWYEIARYPNRFQKDCRDSSAFYSAGEDGTIEVLNRCRDAGTGRERQVRGRAWVVDPVSNARLKVSFFWPIRGDYWIIDLGPDYEYSVVGTPNREYLWILSRTPTLSDERYAAIVAGLERQGFVPQRLVRDATATARSGGGL